MRGIAPVIAVILLLLLTISIIGFAFVFFSRTATTTGTAVEQELQQQLKQSNVNFRIEDVSGNTVYVRNTGSEPIQSNSLSVFVNNYNTNYTLSSTIQPGSTGVIVLPSSFEVSSRGGGSLRISGGIFSDSVSISAKPKSCKGVRDAGMSNGDGVYTVYPDGNQLDVYCDMTTNDGGWTLVAVCKASEVSNCWTTAAKGTVTDPASPTSAKLNDTTIKLLLTSGENITRTYWTQKSRYYRNGNPPEFYNPATAVVFNKITDPNQWSSEGCGTQGKEFFSKYTIQSGYDQPIEPISDDAYAKQWGSPIYSENTGCSCAVNGWSNVRKDSCGDATWRAGCESGPSISHCCACVVERGDLTVWVR